MLAAVAVFGGIWWRWAPGWWPDIVVRVGPTDEMRMRAAASPRAADPTSIAARMLFRRIRDGKIEPAAYLRHRDPRVRNLVAMAMGHIDVIANESELVILAADQEARVRARAVMALARGRTGTSGHALVAAIGDVDDAVRYQALIACGERRIAGCADAAARALLDTESSVRIAAASALAAIGAVEHRDDLRPLLADADPGVRYAAIEALCRLGDERVDEIIATIATLDASERARLAALAQDLALDDRQRARWEALTRTP
ncbi:MAG TPA: HEAT repeat domain-containing protein [Planctomycetota bacterium]|nr:HEAT repeat domain-containing protein [Planctomycetota bacterium]